MERQEEVPSSVVKREKFVDSYIRLILQLDEHEEWRQELESKGLRVFVVKCDHGHILALGITASGYEVQLVREDETSEGMASPQKRKEGHSRASFYV